MKQIYFTLRCKIKSTGPSDEYQYMIDITSNSGKKYTTYDCWHGYATTAKDAKRQILLSIGQTQAIDYILDDTIINNSHGNPYFVYAND